MVVGFFHDHNFISNGHNIYTTGTLSSTFWERYLEHDVEELIVCCRKSAEVTTDNLVLSSTDKVSFNFSPNLSSPKCLFFGADHQVVKNQVKKVDLVICRLPSEIGFAAVKEAKRLGKKVVCEVVACPYDALSYHGSITAKLYARLIKYRMKKWVSVADGALYVTKSELQARYPCYGLTENASNVELDSIHYDTLDFRSERFNARKQCKSLKFGIAGTLKNDTKGIHIAIKALKNIPGSLHVIGAGDPSRYIRLAKEYGVDFQYEGFKANKADVLDWFKDIDVYLQPSFQEGLPRATIEAMSTGCPVLSSDAGGLSELVRGKYIHSRGDFIKLNNDLTEVVESYSLEDDTKRSLNIAREYLSDVLKTKRRKFYKNFIN
ncbi:glycosyltransferase [Pseudoalteromonas sp. Angola-30]|uniref:glycosyltransferase n=1 Tax=Pseudoalteromonas sp. Angola-30 TaxID=3025341 RepID=UPI0023592B97|nr:glycosyltransferase [Pseudoalteromonas sp. Angola-30]MDC9524636.1 glycosyltransferase [Pseudoalteromonas sp. Angola-30]